MKKIKIIKTTLPILVALIYLFPPIHWLILGKETNALTSISYFLLSNLLAVITLIILYKIEPREEG